MSLLSLNNRTTAAAQAAAAYSAFTEGTAAYPTTFEQLVGNSGVGVGTLYCALGVANEIGELAELFDQEALAEDNRRERYQTAWKELGDVQWYIARLCVEQAPDAGFFADHVERAFEALRNDRLLDLRLSGYDLQSGLCVHSGRVLGVVKKMMRDGFTWSDEKRADKMAELRAGIAAMVYLSVDFAERTGPLVGCDGGYVNLLRTNTDKLSGRKERGTLHGDGEAR